MWGLGLLGVGFVVAVRWPRAAPVAATAVDCGADAAAFRAGMRARLEALEATVEAAREPAARVEAATRGRALDRPAGCRVPARWADLVAAEDAAWTRLADPGASENAVAQALADLSGACVACHAALELAP